MAQIGILGAGAWGTALATAIQRAGGDVIIWAREKEVVDAVNTEHENTVYLKGIKLKPQIKATSKLEDLLHVDMIFVTVPTQFMRATLAQLHNLNINVKKPIILCSKGIEKSTLKLVNEIAEEVTLNPLAVLSGPTFATEVALGMPTSIILACKDRKLAEKRIAPALVSDVFKVFYTDDMVSAEIGGAAKNVIAIACGIAEGKRLGQNATAALITRGIKEMVRLSEAKGGRGSTLMELCGIGDLVLTCSSRQSRNMSLGFALGEGKSLEEVMETRVSVAEGVASSESVMELAHSLDVDVPICEAVFRIVHGKADINETIDALIRES